jgi:hypothetical protein
MARYRTRGREPFVHVVSEYPAKKEFRVVKLVGTRDHLDGGDVHLRDA